MKKHFLSYVTDMINASKEVVFSTLMSVVFVHPTPVAYFPRR
ncbi:MULTISPECIES: hypothetical protein [Solitalea]|nr:MULTISPECIES: hypothetical protein [Solitalea]